jgi:hypothetical protein
LRPGGSCGMRRRSRDERRLGAAMSRRWICSGPLYCRNRITPSSPARLAARSLPAVLPAVRLPWSVSPTCLGRATGRWLPRRGPGHRPGLPVVAYEAGPELERMKSLRFQALGSLRVWLRKTG